MRERANWRAALWLRRHRIRGKRKFIWSIVVTRLAFPAAVVATVLRTAFEPWDARHFALRLVASAIAAVVGGYMGGVILWDLVVNRGGRALARRRPIRRRATSADIPPAPEDPRARRFEV